jgi:5-(carboxyamino)imidazole ribonucleotide synthase
MVGAGQLARMTHQAAISLGLSLRVLAESAQDCAALVARDVQVGDHRSLPDLLAFAERCDVVTFDHEHVREEHVRALVAKGAVVRPGPDALRHAQDKAVARERLSALGAPVPTWRRLEAGEPLPASGVAKAVRGGYDGRGVWLLDDDDGDRPPAGADLLWEERVELARELAVLVARRASREARAWPAVETVQRNGICVEAVAPAADVPPAAIELALRIAEQLDVTGVLAVEMFQRTDGEIVVNELAMRPHNSGHWTIEGAATSQFEQHVRAVLDLPLGPTGLRAPCAVMVNVLGGRDDDLAGRLPAALREDVAVHLYGKAPRPGRKLGHVTALGSDVAEARARAWRAATLLRGPE